MILKGNQRSGGRQLAAHLLKTDDNEHVDVFELRGFMGEDLPSAFNEIHAISKGTRAKQPFFSLSLSPPPQERVAIEVFETAIEQLEQKLGLEDQPRAIVFHEKEGRRHAHVVWSRIDTDEMKAINLSFYKMKLQDVSRELYLEHGWQMPAGFANHKDRNPLNFSCEEWQQARRAGLNPKELKRVFQESWAISDSREAFAQALLSQGFILARGDRRGYVAVDYQGEIYAISKYAGVKTKEVKERLGDSKELPSTDQAKAQISSGMSKQLQQYLVATIETKKRRSASFEFKRQKLVEEQRKERKALEDAQRKRWDDETKDRNQRLSNRLLGIWHRLTGKYAKIKRQNEMDTLLSTQRDRNEKDGLIFNHIQKRKQLNLLQRSEIRTHELEIDRLQQDIKGYRDLKTDKFSKLKADFREASSTTKRSRKPNKAKDNNKGYELDI